MTDKFGKIKWINVVLFFSLALNFFVAGYLVSDSRVFKNLHPKKILHKRPEIRIVDYFPHKEKKEFRQHIYDQSEKFRPSKRGIFEGQKEILTIISNENMNKEKLRQAFEKYQNSYDNLQTAMNEIIIEMVLKMDHKTRLDVVERGKRAHERRKKMMDNYKGRMGMRHDPLGKR